MVHIDYILALRSPSSYRRHWGPGTERRENGTVTLTLPRPPTARRNSRDPNVTGRSEDWCPRCASFHTPHPTLRMFPQHSHPDLQPKVVHGTSKSSDGRSTFSSSVRRYLYLVRSGCDAHWSNRSSILCRVDLSPELFRDISSGFNRGQDSTGRASPRRARKKENVDGDITVTSAKDKRQRLIQFSFRSPRAPLTFPTQIMSPDFRPPPEGVANLRRAHESSDN